MGDIGKTLFAFGLGIGTRTDNGRWLDVFFPAPLLAPHSNVIAALHASLTDAGIDCARNGVHVPSVAQLQQLAAAFEQRDQHAQAAVAARAGTAQHRAVLVILASDSNITSTPEAYLKLHLLSHRLAKPNSMNLDGIFAALPTVAWTSDGPIAAEELSTHLLDARLAGRTVTVHSVDKFPRMSDYVVPTGVRIADASRVRLGAYLGDGTTVMHEGFINFNAAALGPNMVEGRISQGVTVGAHSDLGGSASLMGTLSGGGNIVITVGERCLIGANAGSGIPLGDDCTIEAGLYITAGSVVEVQDERGESVKVVKARELAGVSNLRFIRNSRTGRVECRPNRRSIELNQALHANN